MKNEQDVAMQPNNIPVHIGRVVVDGVGRTKNHVLVKSVERIMKATNFTEMIKFSHEAKIHMEKLGLFKSVGITIDKSKSSNASSISYDVIFDVQEPRRVTGGVNTLIGTNDASLVVGLRLPNTGGRGEKVNVQYTRGTREQNSVEFSFLRPLDANPDIVFSCCGAQVYGEQPWSAFKQTDRLTSLGLTFPTLIGVHSFKWEGIWRDLRALPNAAFRVREHAGHSLKSSLVHSISRDSRDDRILPTNGTFYRFSQEYAGIGGDTQFEKHQLQIQLNKSLPLKSVLQFTLDTGILTSLSNEKQRINDLFTIGGPLTLRGFKLNSAGPSEEGCALGGDVYATCGAHLYTPLPFYPGKNGFGDLFRSHLFVTAGSLIRRSTDNGETLPWRQSFNQLSDTMRLSYGGGIVLRMGGIARIELNYVIPVLVQRQDSVCRGFQFGIGIWYS